MFFKIFNDYIKQIIADHNSFVTLISAIASAVASFIALFISIYPSKKKIKPELILIEDGSKFIKVAMLNPSSEIRVIKYLEFISGKRIGKKDIILSENLLNCQDDLLFCVEEGSSLEEKIVIEPGKTTFIIINATRIVHLLNHIEYSFKKNDLFFIRVIDANGRKTTINTKYKVKYVLEKIISKTSVYTHLTIEGWSDEKNSLFDKIMNNNAKVYRIFRYISYSMIPIIIFSYLVAFGKYEFVILNIDIVMVLVLIILLFISLSYTISKNNSDSINYPSLDLKELNFYKILKLILLFIVIYFFVN